MLNEKQLMLDIIQDPAGFEIIELHEDEYMKVRALVGSTRMGDVEDMPGDPEFKCYHEAANRKSSRLVWKIAAPLVWIVPTDRRHDGELYDFSLRGWAHNGSCMSDERNQPISPIQFRLQRPDLAHFFELRQIRNMISQSPNLGLRHGPDTFAAARAQAWQRFTQRMNHVMGDPSEALILAGDCAFRYLRSRDQLGRGLDKSTDFLHRDILDGHTILLADIEHSMTDDQFDQEGDRYRIISSVTQRWLQERRCVRFLSRNDPRVAELAAVTIVDLITERMSELLDVAILESMQ